MTNDFQEHISQITKKAKIKYLDISNRDLNGAANLSEFTALTSLNSYNNKFEDLTWLSTLPNKASLKKINFFGNQLKEIDFAWLLSAFPKLEAVNIENNPVKTKNLNNLTATQFNRLIEGIKQKKFRVISWQGTVLMDLLEKAQQLIQQGNTQTNSHRVYLQNLQQASPQPKAEVKTIIPNNSENNVKNPNTNIYLLVGGLMLLVASVLAIGYWWGKKTKKPNQILQTN